MQQLYEKLGNSALKVCPALHAETSEEKIALGWNIFCLFRNSSSDVGIGNKAALAFIHALGGGGGNKIKMVSFAALTITVRAVSKVVVVVGIIFDSVRIRHAAHHLIKDKKCPTSEGIAKQIKELKALQGKLRKYWKKTAINFEVLV